MLCYCVQLSKMTGGNYDAQERSEDMNRMREHVFTEVDSNMDGVISYSEFFKSTQADDFTKQQGWEVSQIY